MPGPLLVAHRGWASRYPENTLLAVRRALEAGADGVEVDVQLSADGTPYLLHDADLRRIAGVDRCLLEAPDSELTHLWACEPGRFGERFRGERLARLADFAALLADFPPRLAFVEIKAESLRAFGIDAVLDAVLRPLASLGERVVLISFALPALLRLRERAPGVRTGAVLEHWRQRTDSEVRALAPQFVFADARDLPAEGPLDAGGARLVLWEVPEAQRARALCERGAAGVETFAIGELLTAFGRIVEGR